MQWAEHYRVFTIWQSNHNLVPDNRRVLRMSDPKNFATAAMNGERHKRNALQISPNPLKHTKLAPAPRRANAFLPSVYSVPPCEKFASQTLPPQATPLLDLRPRLTRIFFESPMAILPSSILSSFKTGSALLAAALFLLASIPAASADTITSGSGNITVDLGADGTYSVSARLPGWRLSGTLPGPAQNILPSKDKDELGAYQQLLFTYSDAARPMTGAIRIYEQKDLVLFSQTSSQPSATSPSPFPDFTALPQDLYSFSYRDAAFSPPRFGLEKASGPWLLFDRRDHAMIISPASHFPCASMVGDGRAQLGSGFDSQLRNIPARFTQRTFLVFAQGINHAWDIWGRAMTDLQGKERPANDADPILRYYGYWTDHGGAYWYNYDPDKGYQGTLQAVVDEYRAERIPIRYLQLDSWWYRKSLTSANGKPESPMNSRLPEGEWNRFGGTLEYKADPFIFPEGLEAFHEKANLPFVTHNRWIDPASPYHDHYKISGIAAVDRGFWDEIAAYLKTGGVITYEQDWLNQILANSPELSSTTDLGDAFFDGMAGACKAQGLSMQYCMGTPRCFMEGSKYDNLTSIRVSDDRFEPGKYHDFLYTSRLAYALGIWPWTDVFNSTEINNLLLSTLSAGPVGTGDAIGKESKANIMKAVRADGVIVKPDKPILPVDGAYIAEAEKKESPLLSTTYAIHGAIKTIYGVALKSSGTGANVLSVSPAHLGCAGPAYIYDYFAGKGQRLDKGAELPMPFEGRELVYFILAPIGPSGIAFLGDADKFVGAGAKRISSMREAAGKLAVDVVMAANEQEVSLQGYAPAAPEVSASPGQAGPVGYDSSTGLFKVTVKPGGNAPVMDGEDPIRKTTVTFQCPLPAPASSPTSPEPSPSRTP